MLSIDLETLAGDERLGRETTSKLESLRQQVADLSEDIHGLAYRLHPSILDDLRLSAAIRSLIHEFSKRHDIEVSFHERHFPQRIPTTVASCLYRISQESLTNIAKHSETTRVTVPWEPTAAG